MKTVAIVGLSNKPDRASYQVAEYLLKQGFEIIPVNPTITEVMGIKSYPSIGDIPRDVQIDIVDIFRKPEEVISIIEAVVEMGRKPLIWMQEGVGSPEAEEYAKKNGLEVVMNMCMMKVHKREKMAGK